MQISKFHAKNNQPFKQRVENNVSEIFWATWLFHLSVSLCSTANGIKTRLLSMQVTQDNYARTVL